MALNWDANTKITTDRQLMLTNLAVPSASCASWQFQQGMALVIVKLQTSRRFFCSSTAQCSVRSVV